MKKRKKREQNMSSGDLFFYITHALYDLVQKIEGSLNQKLLALGVFLDIDGAFDNVSCGSMDAASGEYGVVLTLPCFAVEEFELRS
jgi:hypothetical protein